MFFSGNFRNFPIDDNVSVGTASDLNRYSFATGIGSSESLERSRDINNFPIRSPVHNSMCLDTTREDGRVTNADGQTMFNQSDLCDVTFLVGPTLQPLYGLKAVMAARSAVLRAMFDKHELLSRLITKRPIGCLPKLFKIRKRSKNNITKKDKNDNSSKLLISLPEHDLILFDAFLTFVHTGSVNLNLSNLAGLLHLSHIYQVKQLRAACWDIADRYITSSTAISLLTSSHRFAQSEPVARLVRTLLDYIDKHAKDVLGSNDFIRASSAIATMVLTRPQLNILENDRVLAMLLWAKRHHRGNAIDLPVTLNRLLENADFTRVTNEKLIRDVMDIGYVPPMPFLFNPLVIERNDSYMSRELVPANRRLRRNGLIHLAQARSPSLQYSSSDSESGFVSA